MLELVVMWQRWVVVDDGGGGKTNHVYYCLLFVVPNGTVVFAKNQPGHILSNI